MTIEITAPVTLNTTTITSTVTIAGGGGAKGDTGAGVPVSGSTGYILSKIDATDYNTEWLNPGGTTFIDRIKGALKTYFDTLFVPYTGASSTVNLGNYRLLHPGAYAEIYSTDGVVAQTIPTGTSVYTKLTGFEANGVSLNCTADYANDKITFTNTGKYLVNCSISAGAGTNNVTFLYVLFLDGVEVHKIHAHRKYASAGDKGNCSLSGIIDVTSTGVDLDIRAKHDAAGGVDLTPTFMNLSVTYIGS